MTCFVDPFGVLVFRGPTRWSRRDHQRVKSCDTLTSGRDIMPPIMPTPMADRKRRNYQKVKMLGKGTFGVVYLVRDVGTSATFVMKEVSLKGDVAQDTSKFPGQRAWSWWHATCLTVARAPVIAGRSPTKGTACKQERGACPAGAQASPHHCIPRLVCLGNAPR